MALHHGEDRLAVGRSVLGRLDHLGHLAEVGRAEQSGRRDAENRSVLVAGDGEAVNRAARDEHDVPRTTFVGAPLTVNVVTPLRP